MLARTVNNVKFYSAMEDGSQTAEIRAIQANMYMQREFVHGLPLKVAQELYTSVLDTLHADGMKNTDKQQAIAVLIHNLQVRIANVLNTDNLLGLACIYFYIDGEDPLNYTGEKDLEKIDIIKSGTAKDRLFFCEKVCAFTPSLRVVLENDLAACLKTADDLIYSQRMNTPR